MAMMKKKGMAKGGKTNGKAKMKKKGMAKGGKMPKKMANGGMTMKKKGMARGGKMKKGYAMGGKLGGGMTLPNIRAAAKSKGYKLVKG
tara:strand:+ start:3311 stop:3574 length:264 start_codon:yes stop_codon:yes gene_type:complete